MISQTPGIHNTDSSHYNDRDDLYSEDYDWLGIIYQEDKKLSVAFITALAYCDNDNWHLVSKDMLKNYFPNNGKVAIFARDLYTSKIGQICYFRPERNTKSSDSETPLDSRYSRYMVNSVLTPIAQVLDWTGRARESLELPILLEQGIHTSLCFSHIIYIRYQNQLYGPIKLEPVAEQFKPQEYIQSSNAGGKKLLVSVYKMPEDKILTSNDGKSRFSVFDDTYLQAPIGQEDWSLPQVVIKRTLKASKEVLTADGNVQLTDNRIRELARLSSQDGSSTLQIEEATLKRAQYILKHQMEQLHDVKMLIEDLSAEAEHPLVKAIREQEIQLRSVEIAQEAEKQVTGKKQHLQQGIQDAEARLSDLNKMAEITEQHLQQSILDAEAKLNELNKIANTTEQRRDQALEVEREVQQRLMLLREEPLRMLADLQITASLFPLLKQDNQQQSNIHAAQQSLHTPGSRENIRTSQGPLPLDNTLKWVSDNSTNKAPANLQALQRKFWQPFIQSHSVLPKNALECFATLVSACIPKLSGLASMSLVSVIAQAITNGRVWSVPVPLTALTPLDLFGKIDADSRQFIPAAGSLADIILQAQIHPQELAIVLLEGIDRAPAMSVTVPLLHQYIQVRQNIITPNPLNLFHLRSITPDDPYWGLSWFTWPKNILLAVTCDDEASNLLLPEACDAWLPNIEAHPRKNIGSRPESQITSSYVPFSNWQRWTESIQQDASARKNEESSFEQQKVYEALSILDPKNRDSMIEEMWPIEDTDED